MGSRHLAFQIVIRSLLITSRNLSFTNWFILGFHVELGSKCEFFANILDHRTGQFPLPQAGHVQASLLMTSYIPAFQLIFILYTRQVG